MSMINNRGPNFNFPEPTAHDLVEKIGKKKGSHFLAKENGDIVRLSGIESLTAKIKSLFSLSKNSTSSQAVLHNLLKIVQANTEHSSLTRKDIELIKKIAMKCAFKGGKAKVREAGCIKEIFEELDKGKNENLQDKMLKFYTNNHHNLSKKVNKSDLEKTIAKIEINSYLKKASNNENIENCKKLAQAYKKLGNTDQAKIWYIKSAKLGSPKQVVILDFCYSHK